MKFFPHIKSRCVVYSSLFALSLFLFSCEDVVEVDLASSDNRLVIDAEILWDTATSGNVQQIYLSRLTNYYETETTKVANAEVYITNTSGDTFTFTETDEAGTYQCNDFVPQLQETYQLFVSVDEETFTATESLITTPEINRIEQKADGIAHCRAAARFPTIVFELPTRGAALQKAFSATAIEDRTKSLRNRQSQKVIHSRFLRVILAQGPC